MDFIKELQWRGMLHQTTPGTEEKLSSEKVTGYCGFDPTASSLQVGNLAAIMLMVHFQRGGHKPLALVGGATGVVGDPSGKSEERNLLTIEEVNSNVEAIKKQLSKFLDFDCGENSAEIVNNHDWFGTMGFLDFLRDIGKHLTVSYMMAKDSVQSRLEKGISYTEFSYQLLQGYDFAHLNKNKNCVVQFGGSDQWGNITTGTELIRRMGGSDAFAVTSPLVTRADGTKFGKSAAGQKLWLDRNLTSPYEFYQFWLNVEDEVAEKYLKVFTLLNQEEIAAIVVEHNEAPHLRAMQNRLAKEVTTLVHSSEDYEVAVKASAILFGKATTDTLKSLSEKDFLAIFNGVPSDKIAMADLETGISVIDVASIASSLFSSKGDVRRGIKGNALSINKAKITDDKVDITKDDLLNGKYLLLQKGKKNYFILEAQ
jgi:tyrosyl-tRNA synthetase